VAKEPRARHRASFGLRHRAKRKLARSLCVSNASGEFSVFSQAVQSLITAC
jgi:hypothetical protein